MLWSTKSVQKTNAEQQYCNFYGGVEARPSLRIVSTLTFGGRTAHIRGSTRKDQPVNIDPTMMGPDDAAHGNLDGSVTRASTVGDDSACAGGVTIEFDVAARMRDGVTLLADVYRPEGPGPWPMLLTRTPYGKQNPLHASWHDPVQVARQGFVVVVQDTRAASGKPVHFRFDRDDGYDSVEWAAQLPGSNGRVGMFGSSALGWTQWLAAIRQPPSLAAIAPALTWSDYRVDAGRRGGALELGLEGQGALLDATRQLATKRVSEHERRRRLDLLLDDVDGLAEHGYWGLPVDAMPVLRRHEAVLRGHIPDAPAAYTIVDERHLVAVPTFQVGGWYDTFLHGTLDNYMALTSLGRHARLVVGPWVHGVGLTDPIGERCFGARARGFGVPGIAEGDLRETELAWLSSRLTDDRDAGTAASEAPVRIFVMGRNEWRNESSWPLQREQPQRWFLGAGGTLSPDASGAAEASTEFAYDPGDPVPTRGGNLLMAAAFPPGAFDQASLEARPDVCVFTSEPLREDLEVTGRVRVVLHAQSSAPSTDWVARLCDVLPDGRSFNLCDGILRVFSGAQERHRVEIDLWSTSNVFLRGHRLRVHVTSSCFPRWDRNLNTGNQRDTVYEVAHQRIWHDPARPSYIEVPVIP
jgi:putative CocE/NonD family hydrolase